MDKFAFNPQSKLRYTHDFWNFNNRYKTKISDDAQQLAHRVIKESDRLIDETRTITDHSKKEVDFRLEERVKNIKFLQDEALQMKQDAEKEEEALRTYRSRIHHAIETIQEKFVTISKKCIEWRDQRRSVDLVHDVVEKELIREEKVFIACLKSLQKTFNDVNEQIRRVRACIYQLNSDLCNKEKSMQIEQTNLKLHETQMSLNGGCNKLMLANNATTPQWEEATNQNIQKTRKEINAATPLRSFVDILLKQVEEDLNNQISRTDEGYRLRMAEMTRIKQRLEEIHKETCLQVNEIERNITKLEKELAEKEGYIALAQCRLTNRSQRPGPELCNDDVQAALVKEMNALRATCARLSQMIADSTATHRYLLSTQMAQVEEINIKTNSLKIDCCDCMTIRNGLQFPKF